MVSSSSGNSESLIVLQNQKGMGLYHMASSDGGGACCEIAIETLVENV